MSFPDNTQWVYPWPQSVAAAAASAQDMVEDGAGGVLLKMADGGSPWDAAHFGARGYQPALLRSIVAEFRKRGLRVYAWVYLYAANVDELFEATNALKLASFDGLVVDAEGEFERAGSNGQGTKAERLLRYLHTLRPLTPFLAYAPFWYPAYHTGILYDLWNGNVDAAMPQVYWRLADYTPRTMVAIWRSVWTFRHPPPLTIPIGDPNGATTFEVKQFYSLTGTPTSWWRYPFTSAVRSALVSISGGVIIPVPAPTPTPTPTPTGGSDLLPISDEDPMYITVPVGKELFAPDGVTRLTDSTDKVQQGVSWVGVTSPNGSHYRLLKATTGGVRQVVLVHNGDYDQDLSWQQCPPAPAPDCQAAIDAATAPLKADITALELQVENAAIDQEAAVRKAVTDTQASAHITISF